MATSNMTTSDYQKSYASEELAQISGGPLSIHRSIFEHLQEGLHRSPNEPAVICPHQPHDHLKNARLKAECISNPGKLSSNPGLKCMTLTYHELHHAALKLGSNLTTLGARERSKILIVIPNGVEFCILLWASILMRLTMITMDMTLLKASDSNHLKDTLRTLRPSIVVLPDQNAAETVREAAQKLKLAPPLCVASSPTISRDCNSFSELLTGNLSHGFEQELFQRLEMDDPNRTHSITFTSGTTSKPKGCPVRVKGMSHMLHSWSWLINEDNGVRALQQLHNSRAIAPAQVLQTWKAGGTVVMPGRNFAIEDTLDAIENHGATFIVLSPTMVHRLSEVSKGCSLATSSVRSIQIGGDAVTNDVLDKCARIFPKASICTHHGMSEGGAAFKWAFFDTPPTFIDTHGGVCPTGTVAAGSTVRVWDRRRNRIALRGKPGEMHISSSSIIEHYLGGADPDSFLVDATARWFNTGDVAIMDDQGIVTILGRRKDAIEHSDGTLIMPSSIENCLQEYLGTQVCVVAIPHTVHGNRPVAIVANMGTHSPSAAIDHVQQVLGPVYTPDHLLCLHDLELMKFPLNATGKVVRTTIQEAVLSSAYTQVGSMSR